ncbi:hypothetical protein CMO90_03090 [Candidatus Woesearchaeota archaeon]|jgi:hypothetical protein|nr:hypothetical protein [Candidatus Woesearchaeota archaeon]|tara:strand:+ start:412 stop:786 length:375 start_codon:yes stop_codon:yes gene_type:complete
MNNNYEPEYVKKQILVQFRVSLGYRFAEDFGKRLGMKLVDTYNHGDNIFIYNTKKGKELDGCEEFKKYEKFIEWAGLRDLKLEKRWKHLENSVNLLERLVDECELPDEEYDSRVKEIVDILEKS